MDTEREIYGGNRESAYYASYDAGAALCGVSSAEAGGNVRRVSEITYGFHHQFHSAL